MARVLGTMGSLKSARDRALPARPRELTGATAKQSGSKPKLRAVFVTCARDRRRMSCVNADLSWRRRPRG